jgi:ABC-type multidrug transport system ATPase subunit
MLSVKKLYKSFGSNHVLKNLSIDFPLGKIIMIIGNNGSGKSTLLNCLSQTTEIDRGSINKNGFKTFFLSDKDNVIGNYHFSL